MTTSPAVTAFSLGLCALIALISDVNSPMEGDREDLIRFLQETIQDNSDPMSLSSLAQKIQQVDPGCAHIWMQLLTASAESIDSLLELVSSFQKALQDGIVDGASQAGILIRTTCLSLDDMLFDRIGVLWKNYHEEIEALINRKEYHEETRQSTPSTHSLRLACLALERTGVVQSTPDQLSSDYPEGHFLRFMQHLSEGERVGAVHSLHQFVDTAMIAERKKEHEACTKRSNVLGHAAVLLASIHAKFGEGSLHKLATEEALRVAQQSGDSASIAFAMALLYESGFGGSAEDLLNQCNIRATGARCFSLANSANLAMAKEFLARGNIQDAWREWMLSTIEKSADPTTVWTDRPARLTTNTRQLQSQQLIVGLEMWESLGFYGMTLLLSKIALNSKIIGLSQQTHLVGKSIQASMYGPELCSSRSRSRYQAALDLITKVNPNNIKFLKALVMHEWACRLGRLQDARVLLGFLQSYLNPCMNNYLLATVQVGSQHALLLSRQGRFDKAKTVLTELLDICKEGDLPKERITVMIQLATNELDASPDIFTGALKPLLDCLELTEKLSIDSLNATTLSLLAQIQVRLSKPKKALPMLKAAMPNLRQQGHIWYFAEAHLTLAKCYLLLANEEKRRVASLNETLQWLERAGEIFTECQDLLRLKEVFYLQARVYNVLPGEVGNRDEACRKFVNLTNYMDDINKPSNRKTINAIFESDFKIQLEGTFFPTC